MIAIDVNRTAVVSEVSQDAVEDIEGRWQTILTTLADRNIHVLPGGTIERYLPSFSGNLFDPSQEAKRNAVQAELGVLQRIRQTGDLARDAAAGGALRSSVRGRAENYLPRRQSTLTTSCAAT